MTRRTMRSGRRRSTVWTSCFSRLFVRSSWASRLQAPAGSSSGSSTSVILSTRRFQRRSPTRIAAVTRAARSGSPASRLISAAACGAAPSPTSVGNRAKGPRSATAMTSPSRSISSCLPPCCQTASGRRSTRRTNSVPGRRRSIVAERTQGRLSSRSLARLGLTARIGVARAAPSAAMMVAASVMSRPSTSMSATTRPQVAETATSRSAASASTAATAGIRLATPTP